MTTAGFMEQLLVALADGPATVSVVAQRLERQGIEGATLRAQTALKRLEEHDRAHCYRDNKGRWLWEAL